MPKLKTKRGAAKRFKKTGTGAWKRAVANHNHILTKKASKRKRRLAVIKRVGDSDFNSVEQQLRI